MLQVYVLDVSSIFDVCCIQVFHVARVLCCSESQGARGVMVARHGRALGNDRARRAGVPTDGVRGAPVYYRRGALGATGPDMTGVGCVRGRGRTASNGGGQGGLRV